MSTKYVIPRGVKEKIPTYFYIGLLTELIGVFGADICFPNDFNHYNLYSSSMGWVEAFYAACEKTNMIQLYKYRQMLCSEDIDLFDVEIENKIISILKDEKKLKQFQHHYYGFLISKKKPNNIKEEDNDMWFF